MLKVTDLKKEYKTGELVQKALDGVSLEFRESEFVAILGPSGSGKTTLLNVIGGLDRYDSGDLIIDGVSTKNYKDRDWDSYRNHTIGFIFQSYNLIPHQTVLSNVELALTISGISKQERRERAIKALEEVGLGEQIHKKPNQMSGGQMQRVAIARALVNNPSIVLADEPTGALDSDTSVQVMDILKEIAKDRLVIMVTHNPELAEQYANRIVKLRDGKITSDSNPVEVIEDAEKPVHKTFGKTSMSLKTALSLSFNNLRTKKARTILTAFAGSIGIIGIALILSLSNGTQAYIDDTEKSTLSQYPITIASDNVDMSSMMSMFMTLDDGTTSDTSKKSIETKPIINDIITSMTNNSEKNDMKAIKSWLDSNPSNIKDYTSEIEYNYTSTLNIYRSNTDDIVKVNPSDVMDTMGVGVNSNSMVMASSMGVSYDCWVQALDNEELMGSQFNVLTGKIPEEDTEVAIVVNANGKISDYTLYALGVKDKSELEKMMKNAMSGKEVEKSKAEEYRYDDLLGLDFTAVASSDLYQQNGSIWEDKSEDDEYMKTKINNGIKLKVVGILQATDDSIYSSPWGFVIYKSGLQKQLIDICNDSDIKKAQEADKDTDIFTGVPFDFGTDGIITMADIKTYMSKLPIAEQTSMSAYMSQMQASGMSEEEIVATFQKQMEKSQDMATYDTNLEKIGAASYDTPSSINIYPKDFEAKDKIDEVISNHNQKMKDEGKEDEQVHYTDIVGTMMKSVNTIVNVITYILIAFVSISLIVSSIMIGIITYISVLERTKEIGILRAMGASKRNISQIFNAETLLIGLFSGILGIGVTELLLIPINAIIHSIVDTTSVSAILSVKAAIVLILLSTILTLIGGLIPAKKAAKKDPVLALRTE